MSKVKRAFEAYDRAQIAMLAVLIPICLLTFFLVAVLLVPYKPVAIYGNEIIPQAACPREPVEVYKEWEVREPVRQIEVEYFWTHPDSPTETYGGTTYIKNVEPQPRHLEKSPINRIAPRMPGEWELVTHYTVYGTRFGFPVRQDFQVNADGFIVVEDGEECE